jgi:hypothetical protein
MHDTGSKYILLVQVIENAEMEWLALPLVGFVQINRDLDCH